MSQFHQDSYGTRATQGNSRYTLRLPGTKQPASWRIVPCHSTVSRRTWLLVAAIWRHGPLSWVCDYVLCTSSVITHSLINALHSTTYNYSRFYEQRRLGADTAS